MLGPLFSARLRDLRRRARQIVRRLELLEAPAFDLVDTQVPGCREHGQAPVDQRTKIVAASSHLEVALEERARQFLPTPLDEVPRLGMRGDDAPAQERPVRDVTALVALNERQSLLEAGKRIDVAEEPAP